MDLKYTLLDERRQSEKPYDFSYMTFCKGKTVAMVTRSGVARSLRGGGNV